MKGGVAKTTSVVEIGTILAKEHDKKVLIIDIDPQTNATFSLITLEAWESIKDSSTMADVLGMTKGYSSLEKDYDINDAIIKSVCGIDNLDLIPSHLELTFLDLELSAKPGREQILKNQLDKTETDYDFILIDCPPNLTLAPQNALMVSDYIVVPVVPEPFPSIGLPLLVNRIGYLKKFLNGCKAEFLGVIFTKVKAGTIIHTQQIDSIRKTARKSNVHTFQTVIPETVRISEAATKNKPAYLINKGHKGINAYITLTQEIILKLEEDED
jgi:chromosome partitioning protein